MGNPKQVVQWVSTHPAVMCTFAAFAIFAYLLISAILLTQLPVEAKLATREEGHAINQPVTIELNQIVSTAVLPKMSPQAKGEWQIDTSAIGTRQFVFVPEEKGFTPATEYTVTLENLKRLTGQPVPSQSLALVTERAPGVTSLTPTANASNVPADSPISAVLTSPNRNMRDLQIQLIPEEKVKPPMSRDDTTFSWQPEAILKQGQEYTLKLFDAQSADPAKPLIETKFTTAKEPGIEKRSEDFLYPEETIDVVFDQSMQKDKPGVTCECEGEGKWADDRTYSFKPLRVEVNKVYKYAVPKGVRASAGGLRAEDAAFEIKTPGAVQATIGELGSGVGAKTAISVYFDQPVKKETATARFGIEPKVDGSFSWPNATTMVFSPKEYGRQATYTASVLPGIVPERFGLNSDKVFSMRFTTEARTVKLNVPLYAQQHPSSCEAASLRMALAFRGVNDIDRNIVQKMGYNPRSKDKANNSWDDPNEMYVGDINGLQFQYQAYGAYAAPIAKAARAHGRDASVHYNISPQFVAGQIHAGNPVVIIGTVSHINPIPVTWNGPNGVVDAWLGQHARTVVGVVGEADNPVGFWVNDPYRGTHEYWSPDRLMRDVNNTGKVPSQAAVIK